MEKYKICPSCGEKNDPSLMECSNCGYELFQVRITNGGDNPPDMPPGNKANLVKICDCGTANPPNARKCISCGEDISDIMPVINNPVEKTVRLISFEGDELLRMTTDNIVIGRSKELSEYLEEKKYVSNTHCRLFTEGEDYYIEDLHSTNSTFVNNKKITEKTLLTNGDEIALGGIIIEGERQPKAAYFHVIIE